MDERFLNQLCGARQHMGVEPFCLHCGYDMRGTPSGRCPECGSVFEHKQWQRGVDEVMQKVNEAEDAAALAPLALGIIVFAAVLRLMSIVLAHPASVWRMLAKTGAAGLSVFALLLLLGLLRHRNLPAWAAEKRQIRPAPSHVLITVFLGLTLIATLLTSW